jgi:prepilin-type processing-associated H-X9-DG protein
VVSRHPDGPPIAFADGHVKSVGSSPPSSWVWSPTR